jgi:hypothetical protein
MTDNARAMSSEPLAIAIRPPSNTKTKPLHAQKPRARSERFTQTSLREGVYTKGPLVDSQGDSRIAAGLIGRFAPCHQRSDCACMLGQSSSLNPKRSRPSECATGLTSVSRYDPWYYAHAYESSEERTAELPRWLHSYNRHRPHGSIGFKPPITRPRTRPEQPVEAPQLASRLMRLRADAKSPGAGGSQSARASGRVC